MAKNPPGNAGKKIQLMHFQILFQRLFLETRNRPEGMEIRKQKMDTYTVYQVKTETEKLQDFAALKHWGVRIVTPNDPGWKF
jgi:hypothetical protein